MDKKFSRVSSVPTRMKQRTTSPSESNLRGRRVWNAKRYWKEIPKREERARAEIKALDEAWLERIRDPES